MAELFYDSVHGYIEHNKEDGIYEGRLVIEGVDISPIEGAYFTKDNKTYLWIHRKPMLEYDPQVGKYIKRAREPRVNIYLEKNGNDVVAFKGEFIFLHFKYSIVGVWDAVLKSHTQRLNLYVERLPQNQQTIINAINERKRNIQK